MTLAPPPRVLVVDDDDGIRLALERGLGLAGYAVSHAADGAAALALVAEAAPAVVVLDVKLPVLDGIKVVRRLRGEGEDVPILILSARDSVADRVAGLDAGADDYLVKPFAMPELLARVQALLRRRPDRGRVPLVAGPLRVDPARRLAWIDGRELELTGREFALLEVLTAHAGMVLTRTQLLERVWGYTFEAQTNVVDVFVGYLRRKLEAGGATRVVHTVRGQGFVLRTRG